jgi:RNase H-fold protein (predicted Holliday junction resolvase)
MKIKRFYESEEQKNISSERVEEILKSLKDFSVKIGDENKTIDSLLTELSSYKNLSSKSNDQIDDSIAALQIVSKNVDDSIDKLDTVINNLDDYNISGRSYLYTENK